MQLIAALPLALEVPSVPDLLWGVAVLLPQLLDHGASEGSPPLTLCLSLLPVCVCHVTVWRKQVEMRICGGKEEERRKMYPLMK